MKYSILLNFFTILVFTQTTFGKVLQSYSTTRIKKYSQDARVAFWTQPYNVMTAHGLQGTLGHMSPIGFWGPYGNQPFNATYAFKQVGNWEKLADFLTKRGGPLSPVGPVLLTSEFGQLFFNNTVPASDLLAPGGALSIMGNAGVWSPLGLMGPFSINGAHGYDVDGDGNFLDLNQKVVRQKVLWGRTYPLHEFYRSNEIDDDPEKADTSFTEEGILGFGFLGGKKERWITSDEQQWIHINALNLIPGPIVTIEVYDEHGNLIESSKDLFLINFVALYVEKGTRFRIVIRSNVMTGYRLFVTGHIF